MCNLYQRIFSLRRSRAVQVVSSVALALVIALAAAVAPVQAGGPTKGWSTGMFTVSLNYGQNGCTLFNWLDSFQHCRIVGVTLPFRAEADGRGNTQLSCPTVDPVSQRCYYITYNGQKYNLSYRNITGASSSDYFWGVSTLWLNWGPNSAWRFNLVDGTKW
jgi:hypothetical protein